jgi:hypothetical protein
LCPELVTNLEGFEETPEAVTKEVVQLMNQLHLGVGTEDVDELIASHSEPMSNEDMTAMHEANKAPREDQDDDEIIQSSPTKTLNVKNLNEAFTYLEKFLNIVEEFYPNAERSPVIRRDVERVTSCYRRLSQERKKARVQLSLDKFYKKADETPSKSAEEPSTS